MGLFCRIAFSGPARPMFHVKPFSPPLITARAAMFHVKHSCVKRARWNSDGARITPGGRDEIAVEQRADGAHEGPAGVRNGDAGAVDLHEAVRRHGGELIERGEI